MRHGFPDPPQQAVNVEILDLARALDQGVDLGNLPTSKLGERNMLGASRMF